MDRYHQIGTQSSFSVSGVDQFEIFYMFLLALGVNVFPQATTDALTASSACVSTSY